MTTAVMPICMGCTHYRRDAPTFVCAAFPDAIPASIIGNKVDHRQPVPGDHGITFDPVTPAAAASAVETFGSSVVVELGYSPGQKRDSIGRFGSGGGGPSARAIRGAMTPEETTAALAAIGVEAVLDLDEVNPVLRGEIVSSLEGLQAEHPDLFQAMPIRVYATTRQSPGVYAETFAVVRSAKYGEVEGKVGPYNTGSASIAVGFEFKTRDPERLHTELRHAEETGWMGGGSVDHVIRHEMGHVFDAALGTKSTAMSGGRGPWAAATRGAKATTNYGKADKGERFAEEFAVVSAGGTVDTPSGRAMEQLVEENR